MGNGMTCNSEVKGKKRQNNRSGRRVQVAWRRRKKPLTGSTAGAENSNNPTGSKGVRDQCVVSGSGKPHPVMSLQICYVFLTFFYSLISSQPSPLFFYLILCSTDFTPAQWGAAQRQQPAAAAAAVTPHYLYGCSLNPPPYFFPLLILLLHISAELTADLWLWTNLSPLCHLSMLRRNMKKFSVKWS